MNENPFKHRFKTTESSKLLEIIDNPNEYQTLAIETARLELIQPWTVLSLTTHEEITTCLPNMAVMT